MQLIIVVETRHSCNSDYQYIKSAIDHFYVERSFKLSKIYAKTKSELCHLDNKINLLKKKYNGRSAVVLCADYDSSGDPLNNSISSYCLKKSFDLVWMNIDVEDVFWGKTVPKKKKKEESMRFLEHKNKLLSNIATINTRNPLAKRPASNLLVVLDKYLTRKT